MGACVTLRGFSLPVSVWAGRSRLASERLPSARVRGHPVNRPIRHHAIRRRRVGDCPAAGKLDCPAPTVVADGGGCHQSSSASNCRAKHLYSLAIRGRLCAVAQVASASHCATASRISADVGIWNPLPRRSGHVHSVPTGMSTVKTSGAWKCAKALTRLN